MRTNSQLWVVEVVTVILSIVVGSSQCPPSHRPHGSHLLISIGIQIYLLALSHVTYLTVADCITVWLIGRAMCYVYIRRVSIWFYQMDSSFHLYIYSGTVVLPFKWVHHKQGFTLYLWCFSLYNNSYYIPIYTLKNTLYNAQILTGLELLKYLLSCYIIVNIHNVIFLRLQKSPRLDVLCCLMPSVNCRPNRQLKKFFVSRSVVLSGRSVSTTEYFLGTYPEAISPK